MINEIWLNWTNIFGDGFFQAFFAIMILGVFVYAIVQFWIDI